MKIKLLFLLIFLAASIPFLSSAQESNHDKKLWAKSILNEKAPEIIIEKWNSKKPNTDGKFVLVDFWATWCGPCRKSIPELNKMQKKFGDKLVIIGLSDEPLEKVKAFNNPRIEYANGIDTKKTMSTFLGIRGIPHMILIDPSGIVRWEGFPGLEGNEFTEDVLKKLLEKYGEVTSS